MPSSNGKRVELERFEIFVSPTATFPESGGGGGDLIKKVALAEKEKHAEKHVRLVWR